MNGRGTQIVEAAGRAVDRLSIDIEAPAVARQQDRLVGDGIAFVDLHRHVRIARIALRRDILTQKGLVRLVAIARIGTLEVPVHRAGAGEADPHLARLIVDPVGDILDLDPVVAIGPDLAQQFGTLRFGQEAHRGAQAAGPVAAEDADAGRLGGERDAVARVEIERPFLGRQRRLGRLQAHEPAARLGQRQGPLETGHCDLIEVAIAQPRAVEPIDLAADRRAHQHVIEAARERQRGIDAIALLHGHERRLCIDAEPTQNGQQQHRLAFAVAEPLLPDRIRAGGLVAAQPIHPREIADLRLDKLERRERTRLGIGRCGGDAVDLGLDRRIRSQRRRLIEQGCKQCRQALPIGEVGGLQAIGVDEAPRRLGRDGRGEETGLIDRQHGLAIFRLALDRLGQTGPDPPPHALGLGPAVAEVEAIDRRGARKELVALAMRTQHRIERIERVGKLYLVTDA